MTNQENIVQLFFDAAKNHPSKVAIVADQESIDYRNLVLEVEKTAAYFISKGIKSGDRVLVFVPMSVDLYRILLALFSIGATAVFLDEWVSQKRLDLCAKIANCQGFIGITKSHLLRLFSKAIRKIPVVLKTKGRSDILLALPIAVSENHPALITFTTGSTGTPKAAVRTHQFLATQFEILQQKVGSGPDDIEITNLPIVLFINLGVGATTVICNFSPKKAARFNYNLLFQTIESANVTRIVFSPYLLNEYCDYLNLNSLNNTSIHQLFTGGGPVFPMEAKPVIERFPEIQSEVIFGSTEAEPMSSISMANLALRNVELDKGLAVGVPHHEAEIKIIEISDAPLKELNELPFNQVGEIIVSGRHVLANYFNNLEAFARNKIIVGDKIYHRTGDSGFINDKNELFLTGRCQAIIHTATKSYYPFLVEYQLRQIIGVEVGTLIQLNEKLVVVLEQSKHSNKSRNEIEQDIKAIGFENELIVWTQIPRDPRHHSKIDTEKLKQLLSKKVK